MTLKEKSSPLLSLYAVTVVCVSQGNYATQDSSAICHLMPRRHQGRVKTGGGAGICTLWQFRSKVCYYIYLSLTQRFQSIICDFTVKRVCKTREEEEEEENTITFRLKCIVIA